MTSTVTSLRFRQPDDWHVHFRDGDILKAVVPYTARQFRRAVVMPNLVPPITDSAAARSYRDRILQAVPAGIHFTPLMTCYLTANISPQELRDAYAEGVFFAAKLYPAGATTNSHFGVSSLDILYPILEMMEKIGMPLLIHGESTDTAVDIFDREKVFIDSALVPLRKRFPGLRIVLEHITTADAVEYIESEASPLLGATVTPHHLMLNRNALFAGGIRPHLYCLPIIKRETHRLALRKAAVSGKSFFFAGTDTAPHTIMAKECSCGCAGIFNAPTAIECYTQVFEEENALDKLEAFLSLNGAAFHNLPVNDGFIEVRREALSIPAKVETAAGVLHPFLAGETTRWQVCVS